MKNRSLFDEYVALVAFKLFLGAIVLCFLAVLVPVIWMVFTHPIVAVLLTAGVALAFILGHVAYVFLP